MDERQGDESAAGSHARSLVYNNLNPSIRYHNQWNERIAKVDASFGKGMRAYPA
jgi:hypothetical protein